MVGMKKAMSFVLCVAFIAGCLSGCNGKEVSNTIKKELLDTPFYLSACVDFPDDAIYSSYSPESLDKMMQTLHEAGIKRVYWYDYGNEDYGLFWKQDGVAAYKNAAELMKTMPNPTAAAIKAPMRLLPVWIKTAGFWALKRTSDWTAERIRA